MSRTSSARFHTYMLAAFPVWIAKLFLCSRKLRAPRSSVTLHPHHIKFYFQSFTKNTFRSHSVSDLKKTYPSIQTSTAARQPASWLLLCSHIIKPFTTFELITSSVPALNVFLPSLFRALRTINTTITYQQQRAYKINTH